MVVLRRPHLVLAYIGGDDCVAAGNAVQFFDYVGAAQLAFVVFEGVFFHQITDMGRPFAVVALGKAFVEGVQDFFQVSYEALRRPAYFC